MPEPRHQSPKLLVVTGMRAEAEIAASSGVLVLCSAARPNQLRQTLSRLREPRGQITPLERFERNTPGRAAGRSAGAGEGASIDPNTIAAIVSFGVAGGLDPALHPGDLVLASEVRGETVWPVSAELAAGAAEQFTQLGLPVHTGAALGCDTPALTPGVKARLRQETGAVVIDMESHIAADWAARHDLPLMVLRAVADPAERALPGSAMAAIDPDGTIRLAPVLIGLLKRPAELPALIAAARDSAAALKTLRGRRALLAGLLGGFLGADFR